jgi:hypothetical protein
MTTSPQFRSTKPLAFAALVIALGAVHCGLIAPEPAIADAGHDAAHARGSDGGRDGSHAPAEASVGADADAQVDAGHDAPKPPADTGVDAASDACEPEAPERHRAMAPTCSATRPPGYNPTGVVDGSVPGGECWSDTQCSDGGRNGRCTVSVGFAFCSYDECVTDSDCTAMSLCVCGATPANYGRNPNECVPAACHVDSDCGPGGYCSPSPNPCLYPSQSSTNYAQVYGYYCHTARELCAAGECVNAHCQDAGGTCEWESTDAGWRCQFATCD